MYSPFVRCLGASLLLAHQVVAVAYSNYILAPSTRTLIPATVYQSFGSVSNPQNLCDSTDSTTTFDGNASVTYDFHKDIAGIVTLEVESALSVGAHLGITFAESSLWISNRSSDATADSGLDATLWFTVDTAGGKYTSVAAQGRGAFRYLTLVSNSTTSITLKSVSVNYTAAPTQDLQGYTGYFHCDDELINQIWYAGAYTVQLATIDPKYGNALALLVTWPPAAPSMYDDWYSNYTITNGTTALADGGKRDRLVWAGDMSISLETAIVSTYDLPSVRNSLEALLALQTADGRFPYASRPFPDQESFTYHLHTLINAANYYHYSSDHAWLVSYWTQLEKGISWALGSVDDTSLANVSPSASSDWLRSGMGGHVRDSKNSFVLAKHQLTGATFYRILKQTPCCILCFNKASIWRRWFKIQPPLQTGALSRNILKLLQMPCYGIRRRASIATMKQQRCILKMAIHGLSRQI